MQEHRSTGASSRRRGDIVRHASLEAGGWCRRWQALCEVPVRAYRVDGVADGKLFADTRARIQGGWCRRWQALCEVPVRAYRMDGQPMANALQGTRIQVWKSVDSQGLCARCLCTLSVHVVCALHLCTSSVHVVCALHLCTLSVHVLVDSCREGSHRATRRRHACHLASPSCHRDHIEYSCHRIQLP